MMVKGKQYRTIWPNKALSEVTIIDQTYLPFEFKLRPLRSLNEVVEAIKKMRVRGAPLIGVAAAYGMAIALMKNSTDKYLIEAKKLLIQSRPTAVNLAWAVNFVFDKLKKEPIDTRISLAWRLANELADQDVRNNLRIGELGL